MSTAPTALGGGWLAVVGILLAFGALVPAATSAAWQDPVYYSADVKIVPSLVPTELDAGDGFTCALVGGDLWCWGKGTSGQLGVGNNDDSGVPVSASATAMVVGTADTSPPASRYACGVSAAQAYCWGDGGGRLGNFDVDSPWQTPTRCNIAHAGVRPARGHREPVRVAAVRPAGSRGRRGRLHHLRRDRRRHGGLLGKERPADSARGRAHRLGERPDPAADRSLRTPRASSPPGAKITSLSTTFENACFIADEAAPGDDRGTGTAGAPTRRASSASDTRANPTRRPSGCTPVPSRPTRR